MLAQAAMSATHALLLTLPCCLAATAEAMAPDGAQPSSSSGSITEIVVERTTCYGSCPVDMLVLRDNGKVTYQGTANTRLTGNFAGEIAKASFDRLAQWLVTEGYFQLLDHYRPDSIVSHRPSEVIRVTRGGERKTVINESPDLALKPWAMANVIRAVAADTYWQPANSGIRGQALVKQPGEEWRPRPEEDIWVSFADSRQRLTTRTDRDGRFEINLAAGTYTVLWQGTAHILEVAADRFTEADLRFDVAANDAAHLKALAANYPPPPPEDGLYRLARASSAKWALWQEQRIVMLGDRTEPTILEKRMESDSVDNSTFRLTLILPYDATVNAASHALIVGGVHYAQFGSIHRGQEISGLVFRISGEEQAGKVALHFGLTPVRFSKPDQRFRAAMTPAKQSFRRGEPVTATLEIANTGTAFIEFSDWPSFDGRRDDYAFTALRNGQALTDLSFPGNRGGTSVLRGLAPGATFSDTVDLTKWFDFKEAGSYEIHALYRLNFRDRRNPAPSQPVQWSENIELDFTVTMQ